MIKVWASLTSLMVFMLISLNTYGAGKSLPLTPLDKYEFAKTKEAFAILEISAGGTAPSIELSKLDKNPENYEFTINRRQRVNYTLDLKDVEDGYYVIELPEGLYQIMKVNAPLFNLPFRYDTSGRIIWRWSIKQNYINYLGKLNIHQDRSEDSIAAELMNRFSQSLPELTTALSKASVTDPIRIGLGYRDDFYEELQQ
ncbi:hypothetical protein [Sessilibacter sp. MAH4]